eukprot:gnl/Chilomastix_cuspidata/541.p2 GENE.gnl/Chilomastix_cuspidata/541~~gnl/Chilomastix_cuspidata/541.p2  ORF type:complete len:818 (-),score=265.97 gnl/Chilomastix_cuspidata/541:1363-3816(-)
MPSEKENLFFPDKSLIEPVVLAYRSSKHALPEVPIKSRSFRNRNISARANKHLNSSLLKPRSSARGKMDETKLFDAKVLRSHVCAEEMSFINLYKSCIELAEQNKILNDSAKEQVEELQVLKKRAAILSDAIRERGLAVCRKEPVQTVAIEPELILKPDFYKPRQTLDAPQKHSTWIMRMNFSGIVRSTTSSEPEARARREAQFSALLDAVRRSYTSYIGSALFNSFMDTLGIQRVVRMLRFVHPFGEFLRTTPVWKELLIANPSMQIRPSTPSCVPVPDRVPKPKRRTQRYVVADTRASRARTRMLPFVPMRSGAALRDALYEAPPEPEAKRPPEAQPRQPTVDWERLARGQWQMREELGSNQLIRSRKIFPVMKRPMANQMLLGFDTTAGTASRPWHSRAFADKVLVACEDAAIRVFNFQALLQGAHAPLPPKGDRQKAKRPAPVATLFGHSDTVTSLAGIPFNGYANAGVMASVDYGGNLILWDFANERDDFDAAERGVAQPVYAPDGSIEGYWAPRHRRIFQDTELIFTQFASTGASRLIVGGATAHVFDVPRGEVIHEFSDFREISAYAEDGGLLATGTPYSGASVILRDLSSGQQVGRVGDYFGVLCIRTDASRHLVAIGARDGLWGTDGRFELFDIRVGNDQPVFSLGPQSRAHGASVGGTDGFFMPSKTICSGIYDTKFLNEFFEQLAKPSRITPLAGFIPRTTVTAQKRNTIFTSNSTHTAMGGVFSVALDHTKLITGHDNGKVRIFDIRRRGGSGVDMTSRESWNTCVVEYPVHTGPGRKVVNDLTFLQNKIFSASQAPSRTFALIV